MRRIFASGVFLCVLISFLPEVQASLIEANDQVRVRLQTLPGSIQVSGLGLRFQTLSSPFQPVAIPQTMAAEIRLLPKDNLKLWALRLNNQEREHLFPEKFLMVQGTNLRINGQSLPEKILLTQTESGKVDVVGVMSIEDYIVGVLASEMPLGWPVETLKAQAVAARSYALAVIQERKDKYYHLESTVLDQVFRHVMSEDTQDPKIKKAMVAVAATKGVKLYGPNKRVLKAFYHADCGGQTISAKEVWKYGVNAGTTTDASCPTSPSAQWKLSLNREELARRLGVQAIQDLQLIQEQGHRVKSVKLVLPNGSSQLLAANEFRSKLGFQDLKSTLFDMHKGEASFQFEGRGFGHGVGLCQWGSRSLGQKGYNYKQILAHYYPLAQVR
ncbi:SpoIID/LytB domain-containing protein [Bdellovibrio sp. HCB2-146]|uniref:SpoIID/LytB domain-containing protein n=1 Tax=Bdellovibrio sp. HCB2-146 TaxID=3394362 RepID=UPI0039BCBD5B